MCLIELLAVLTVLGGLGQIFVQTQRQLHANVLSSYTDSTQ